MKYKNKILYNIIIINLIILFSVINSTYCINNSPDSTITIGVQIRDENGNLKSGIKVRFFYLKNPLKKTVVSNFEGLAEIRIEEYYLNKILGFVILNDTYSNPPNRTIRVTSKKNIEYITINPRIKNKKNIYSSLLIYAIDRNRGEPIKNYSCKISNFKTNKIILDSIFNLINNKINGKFFKNKIFIFEFKKNGYIPINFPCLLKDNTEIIKVEFQQNPKVKIQPVITLIGVFYDYKTGKSLADVEMNYKIDNSKEKQILSDNQGLIKLDFEYKNKGNKFTIEEIYKKKYKIKYPIPPFIIKSGVNDIYVGLEKKSLYFKNAARYMGIGLTIGSFILSLHYDSEYNKEAADYHSKTYGTVDDFNKVRNNMEYSKIKRNFFRNILLPLGLASFSVSFIIN